MTANHSDGEHERRPPSRHRRSSTVAADPRYMSSSTIGAPITITTREDDRARSADAADQVAGTCFDLGLRERPGPGGAAAARRAPARSPTARPRPRARPTRSIGRTATARSCTRSPDPNLRAGDRHRRRRAPRVRPRRPRRSATPTRRRRWCRTRRAAPHRGCSPTTQPAAQIATAGPNGIRCRRATRSSRSARSVRHDAHVNAPPTGAVAQRPVAALERACDGAQTASASYTGSPIGAGRSATRRRSRTCHPCGRLEPIAVTLAQVVRVRVALARQRRRATPVRGRSDRSASPPPRRCNPSWSTVSPCPKPYGVVAIGQGIPGTGPRSAGRPRASPALWQFRERPGIIRVPP